MRTSNPSIVSIPGLKTFQTIDVERILTSEIGNGGPSDQNEYLPP